MTSTQNKKIVTDYIQTVWNGNDPASIDKFISDDYTDFSFPPGIPPTKAGLNAWIKNTSDAFDHTTVIESAVEENGEVALRISFTAKHKGKWRNIAPTGKETTVKGFRFFKLQDGKIVAHWALIDGEALQTALTDHYKGCELPG
jgi:predicted SnoaL-like aldol condensation-catalyzing enzyme